VAQGCTVYGLRRRPAGRLPDGVLPVAADVTDPASLANLARELRPERRNRGGTFDGAAQSGWHIPRGPDRDPERGPDRDLDAVVYAVSADGRDDDAYRRAYVDGPRNLLRALGETAGRFLFVSSTGVYGDAGGARVDETTPPAPDRFTGRRLLEGEELVLAEGGALRDGVAVIRFGGIYGPGRTRLIDQVRSGRARCPAGGPLWTNRIHRDDCAGFLAHLLTLDRAALPDPPVYLGVDSEPADLCDVLRWLARRLGVPEPPIEASEDADGADRSARRRSNKRCDNTRLRESGYRLLYPTFREGYEALIADRA
jgi:nucleoside-diphosphate-sugar epimerase